MLRFSLLWLLILLSTALSGAPLSGRAARDHSVAMDQAARLLAEGHLDEAWKAYQTIEKDTHDHCSACELAMARIRLAQNRFGDAWKFAAMAMKNDTSAPMAFEAIMLQGDSDAAQAGKNSKDKHLMRAEQEFRQAILLRGDQAINHFRLARVLLKEKRYDDGKAELATFLTKTSNGPDAEVARLLTRHPELVNENLAPMFTATLQDGRTFSLADQQGKVVVLDFWATWCGPCLRALPDMIAFVHHQSGKPVVIVSISDDRDEKKWRQFTLQHKMDWPQIFDGAQQLQRAYGVNGIPTWVVLDGEGVIQQRMVGYGFGRADSIDRATQFALKRTKAELRVSSNGK